jgi:hypothetical protein
MKLSSSPSLVVRAATAVGAIALVLMVCNLVLFFRNEALQADVNQRQQYINEGATIARVNEGLVRELMTSAETNNDQALRDVLHQQGINYTVTPNAASAAPAASSHSTGR